MEILTDKILELNKDGFYKYNSIENHYSTKYTNKIPQEIKDASWVSSIKYDGANLSIYIQPDQPLKIGKRSGWITEDENFFDVWNVLKKYQGVIDYFQNFVNESGCTIRFFAELYGSGIQKRIDYGTDKYIKVYDVMVGDYMAPPVYFIEFVRQHSVFAPVDTEEFCNFFVEMKYHENLVAALSIDVEKDGIEGIVIKPYADTVYLYGNDRLIIKKKSSIFADIAKEKIGGKIQDFNPEQMALADEFKRYVTQNRMLDLFSKHGEMTDIKQMGAYIKLLLADARVDFEKENDISNLDSDTKKIIFNIGSMAANMLRDHIKSTVRI